MVHEAYLRLVGPGNAQGFSGRGHFFAAAAEAMRRILVENARRKKRTRHGGENQRVEFNESTSNDHSEELLELNDVLDKFAAEDSAATDVAKLHVFAGMSIEEAAESLGISRATAYRHWSYAKAWLRCEMGGEVTRHFRAVAEFARIRIPTSASKVLARPHPPSHTTGMDDRDDYANKGSAPPRDWVLNAIPVIGLVIFLSLVWVAILIFASAKR